MSKPYAWEKVWAKGRYSTDAARLVKAKRKYAAFDAMGAIPPHFGNIAEIGCGNSAFFKLAIERGVHFESYLGIDKSPTALSRAKANTAGIGKCSFLNIDAAEIPIKSGSINTIIALGVLEHIEDVSTYIQELRRIATPGATFLISTSNTRSAMHLARRIREFLGAWPYGFQRNDSVSSLTNILKPSFEINSLIALHGDADFVFSTAIDMGIGLIAPMWGRYLVCKSVAS